MKGQHSAGDASDFDPIRHGVFFATLTPVMIALGAFCLGAVGFKVAHDNIVNVMFGAMGLIAIVGAAFAIDAFMDSCGVPFRSRIRFLGGGYFLFAAVVAALSPTTLLMVVWSNAVNICEGAQDRPLCLSEAANLDWKVWIAIAACGISLLLKLMTREEYLKYTLTGAVAAVHFLTLLMLPWR
jgi:hypothetical protein